MYSKITTLCIALTATLAAAAPVEQSQPITLSKNQAAAMVKQLRIDGCDVLGCLEAEAGGIVACAAAAAEGGVNPFADAACFAAILAAGSNPPAICNGCL